MKRFMYTLPVVCALIPIISDAATTNGYIRKNGTSVAPYQRTSPNHTNRDNFSTSGNRNPYSSKQGYRAKDYSPEARRYGSGKVVSSGSRGGQSYVNKSGRKTYVPKR